MSKYRTGLESQQKAKEKEAKGAELKVCPFCKVDIEERDLYCWSCGKALKGVFIKVCSACGKPFKTSKPQERNVCNRCSAPKKDSILGRLR